MRINRNLDKNHPNLRSIFDANGHSEAIKEIIEREIVYYEELEVQNPEKRIFIGGANQGATLALYMQLMRLHFGLGGVCLFSGQLIHPLSEIAN